MRRIVDWPFFVLTLILTGACLAVLVEHVHGWAWVLFVATIIPVYATIYQALLFGKALFHKRWTPPDPPAAAAGEGLPGIAFLIASYQEPFEVAKMTFDSARDIEYAGPREIIVVDNSHALESDNYKRWKEYVESHEGKDPKLRVVFRYNEKKGGLKPGNIDLGQTLIESAKYVIFLDVDSSLPLHGGLLERAVAAFEADPKLGVLQFNTIATNDHFNQLTGPIAVVQNGNRLRNMLRGDGGFAIFYGHNGMWRRALLEINGPWLEHYRGNVMVTEDLLKTVAAYTRGYDSRYIDCDTGEWIPSSLDALESMWMRWAYGGFQVCVKYLRPIVKADLPTLVRLDLIIFVATYATALFYPLSLLWFLLFPPGRVGLLTLLMIIVPPAILGLVVHKRYTSQLSVSTAKKLLDLYVGLFVIDAFTQMVGLKAVFNFLVGRTQGWRVTTKDFEDRPTWPQVLARHVYIIGVALAMLAVLLAAWGIHTQFDPTRVLAYLPPALVAVHLLSCVAVYGRQGRSADNYIEGTTIDGYNFRNAVLAKVPLFHGTNALFQHGLALRLRPRTVAAGEVVVAQGDPGHEMYLVARGDLAITDNDRLVRTLGAGSFFGERALLLDEPRNATVRAVTSCELFVLGKHDFLKVLRDQPKVARTVAAQAKARYQLDLGARAIAKLAAPG